MTPLPLQALIFDVDGTLADTEAAHLAAFNQAFAEEGIGWHWDKAQYTQLLNISGGKERMLHFWRQTRADVLDIGDQDFTEAIAHLHQLKTAAYEAMVAGGAVSLRPGVLRLMQEALAAGLKLAIATTTSPVNIATLLRQSMGADWRQHFTAIGDASTSPLKKPHPQVYLHMLHALSLSPSACVAFEDSGNGLRAASAAGIATVITPTGFTAHHDFTGALRVLPDLGEASLPQIQAWHAAGIKQVASH